MKTTQNPSVARVVHYVSHGTPGGEYLPACRAATITEVDPAGRVGLAVLNPTGLFFRSLAEGGALYCAEGSAGTWHWPEGELGTFEAG